MSHTNIPSLHGVTNTLFSRLQNVFNDLSGSVSLAWVGDGTGVLLALTTFQVPLFMIRIGQSKLYRSEDYGKTFQDVTHLINHTFIQTELGIAIGPENSGKVILTGDLLERSGAQIFRSVDFGRSFAQTSLPFHPRMQIIYNPHNSDVLLAISSVNDMWLSEDFGVNWRRSHDMVCLVKWGPENTIFFSTNPNGSCSDRGSLELKKTSDYGRTFKTIGSRIYSFGLGGRFVFSSVMTGVVSVCLCCVGTLGVYMTSVLDEDGSVQTVVTFDQGARWQPLRKPWNSVCDSTAANPHMCSLHIHASYSISIKMNVPMPPHSEHNAVGLILAHGSVGDVGSLTSPDVYVSDDGGYTWLRALNGPHHYAILDSGGLLVAVEHVPHPVSQIKFSTDEGQCWHMFNFTDQPIFFTGLAAEPGARSMNVSLWGYRDFSRSQHWVSVTIDFRQVLSRDCGDGDYVQWLAHSDNTNGPTDGCVLGYKERFLRLRKDSVCWNGRDYVVMTDPTPCPCTLDDYQCDFGYFRPENSSECEPQPELKGQALEFCLHGNKEQLQTSGYRKIPGNHCQGGIMPERREIDLSTKCISNMIRPDTLTDSHVSLAPIVAVVISLLLVSAAAGVLLIKKYVCGGRFLVHRYSVLQQHAEANGIEGIDDFNIDGSSKMHYHDESDEDLLE
uniref:VPS10 domain-containing protein n=1 Tax=Denticeps clupeoides TaxID=299321 RepID=A0AAY4CWA2_9TELE